ncbi:MAG: hypothetical protein ACE5JS_07445, partial [Nitrospinota bacterium]
KLPPGANNYLLTVNGFLVTLYGLAGSIPDIVQLGAWLYVVPVAGIAICFSWSAVIRSYRDINTAKFKVIHEIENYLPGMPYAYEWKLAEEGRGKVYKPISQIERIIPFVFIALYVVLAGLPLAK